MKTMNRNSWQRANAGKQPGAMRGESSRRSWAFTLVELLVVIAIIGVLAAFTIPALDAVRRHQAISQTQAEMEVLDTAIKSYHATYGFYPPGNPANPLVNQLYYELEGVTNNGTEFITLDGSSSIKVGNVSTVFSGVGGFINCSKPSSGEDAPVAKNFISGLRPNQTATYTVSGVPITVLIGSAGGPDPSYQPLGKEDVNPWRYRYPGVDNPDGYDLWMQLSILGKTNLICNWSTTVQINNPLP